MLKEGSKFDFAVLGLGLTGQSAIRFLATKGASLLAMDTRDELPKIDEDLKKFVTLSSGGLDHASLDFCQKIILSPGLGKSELGFDIFLKYGSKVIGDIELFSKFVEAPVIAITGTNGKTTVTTLVGRMLESVGFKVLLGGNIGTPALDLLSEPIPDFYILELSSFQLETTMSLRPRVAAILNFGEDHLDRYKSLQDYLDAKLRILRNADVAVLNRDDSLLNNIDFDGERISFGFRESQSNQYGISVEGGRRYLSRGSTRYADINSLSMLGDHNVKNALASLAICGVFTDISSTLIEVLLSFVGLPHRSEFVGTVKGIRFVNDSKATNVDAATVGISSCMSDKGGVLIFGGIFKGGSTKDLIDAISNKVRAVVLIGRSADFFYRLLRDKVECVRARCMDSAVQAAAEIAQEGEVVLLSPACSSLDMFADFEARGRAFKRAIRKWGDL